MLYFLGDHVCDLKGVTGVVVAEVEEVDVAPKSEVAGSKHKQPDIKKNVTRCCCGSCGASFDFVARWVHINGSKPLFKEN